MQRTLKDGDKLTDEEAERFSAGSCPDCGCIKLVEGPHGGLSINFYCGDDEACGSRFNFMGPFGIERISAASPKKVVAALPASTPYRG